MLYPYRTDFTATLLDGLLDCHAASPPAYCGKVLVAGGGALPSELYDPKSNTWTATAPMAYPRSLHTATALRDGTVLVTGGQPTSLGGIYSTAEIFDPSAGNGLGAWHPAGLLNVGRFRHTATLLPNGKVLIASGSTSRTTNYSDSNRTETAELYDPSAVPPTFTLTGALARDPKVDFVDCSPTTTTTASTLPVPSTTTTTAPTSPGGPCPVPVPYGRSDHRATLLDGPACQAASPPTYCGKVLVEGGVAPDAASPNGVTPRYPYYSSAELYDPNTGTWALTGYMKRPRYGHSATPITGPIIGYACSPNCDKVLVAGGSARPDYTGETYDPASGSWALNVGEMFKGGAGTNRRIFHEASILPSGGVLVAGGANNTDKSAEVYDPGADPSVPPGYVPLPPARILDTRPGKLDSDGFNTPVGENSQIDVPVSGVGGVPAPAGAGAVVLNVTVTQPTAASDLTVFPTGVTRPTVSNLNYVAGQTVPNLVIVKVGQGGKASFYNKFGSTHVIADVMGWFPTGPAYNPLTPARILDTRPGKLDSDGFNTPVGENSTIDVPVTGVGNVPPGAGAVVLNVTVTQPTAASDLTVFPTGVTRPTVSNLNYVAGQTVPNLVIVKVGRDGKASFYNKFGSTHVIADVMGWFPTGSAYNPLTPARILDTRPGKLDSDGFNTAVGPAGQIDVPVTGVGGVPATVVVDHVPVGAGAVVLNVTVTQPTAASDLTVFPTGVPRPTVSNLNYVAGQTVPNLVIAKVGPDGKASFYNKFGSTHVIADVMGWFPA